MSSGKHSSKKVFRAHKNNVPPPTLTPPPLVESVYGYVYIKMLFPLVFFSSQHGCPTDAM